MASRVGSIGEEGRGVPAIIRMVNHTRLDCLLGSTTGLRRGTIEAIHHARHRAAFGARLVDQPAMRNVLADLAIESEAATVTAMRVARSYDDADGAVSAFCHRGREVLGQPSARRRTPPRRSSAWAATALSRSPACRCCTATRR